MKKNEWQEIKTGLPGGIASGLVSILVVTFFLFLLIVLQLTLLQAGILFLFVSFWVIFGHFVQERFQLSLAHKVLAERYDSHKFLNTLIEKLVPIINNREAIRITAFEIAQDFRLSSVHYLIKDKKKSDDVNYILFSEENKAIQVFSSQDKLIKDLKIFHTHFYLHQEEFQAEWGLIDQLNLKKAWLIPLFSSKCLEGALILDMKRSGRRLDLFDENVLSVVVNHLKAVFDRTLPYEQIQSDYQKSLSFAETISRQAAYGTMINGIAHELKNPLGMMKWSAELLPTLLNDPESLQENAAIILKHTDRAFKVLDRMIKYGQSGVMENHPKEMDITTVIQDVYHLSAQQCQRSNIKFELNLQSIPNVYGDDIGLHQAIVNVVLNAIQAIGQDGKIELSVRSEQYKTKLHHIKAGVVVIIKDSGKGIPSDIKEKIFEPFFTTKYSGQENQNLGLGLSIALKVIEAHEGIVEVESEFNKGTTFKLYIPAVISS